MNGLKEIIAKRLSGTEFQMNSEELDSAIDNIIKATKIAQDEKDEHSDSKVRESGDNEEDEKTLDSSAKKQPKRKTKSERNRQKRLKKQV